jgi:hypothetical protein
MHSQWVLASSGLVGSDAVTSIEFDDAYEALRIGTAVRSVARIDWLAD